MSPASELEPYPPILAKSDRPSMDHPTSEVRVGPTSTLLEQHNPVEKEGSRERMHQFPQEVTIPSTSHPNRTPSVDDSDSMPDFDFDALRYPVSQAQGYLLPSTPAANEFYPSRTVLSESQASLLCRTFGTSAGLLAELNSLCGSTIRFGEINEQLALGGSADSRCSGKGTKEFNFELEQRCLSQGLDVMISQGHDLGTAYAWFRAGFHWRASHMQWKTCSRRGLPDLTTIQHPETLIYAPISQRHPRITNALGRKVIPADMPPRRLWDVVANRVIPYSWHNQSSDDDRAYDSYHSRLARLARLARSARLRRPVRLTEIVDSLGILVVSHAWTSDMQPRWTPINQYEWPVPLPEGVDIENVRRECLSHDADYVWVDVLCLRQNCDAISLQTRPLHARIPFDLQAKAHIQQEEWKVDVPTIGNVYRNFCATSLRYYSGLGRPFSLRGWDGDRHWVNRAWTLQETVARGSPSKKIIGGLESGERWEDLKLSEIQGPKGLTTIHQLIADIERTMDLHSGFYAWGRRYRDPMKVIAEMSRRQASNAVDKVAGLGYLLDCYCLPIYVATESLESAWGRLVSAMDAHVKEGLLYSYPYMSAAPQWYPTWEQMMKYPNAVCATLTPKFPLQVNMSMSSEPFSVLGHLEFNLRTRLRFQLLPERLWERGDFPTYKVTNYKLDGICEDTSTVFLAQGVLLPDNDYIIYRSLVALDSLVMVCVEVPGTGKEMERVRRLRGITERFWEYDVVKVAVLHERSPKLVKFDWSSGDVNREPAKFRAMEAEIEALKWRSPRVKLNFR